MKFSEYWTDGECIDKEDLTPGLLAFMFSKRGWVYIARNSQSASGALKIGRTSKSPFERMSTLVTSGVEGSYELLHAVAFVQSHWAEHCMHRAFVAQCHEKEFFGITPTEAYSHLLALQRQEMVVLHNLPRSSLLHAPSAQQFLDTYHAYAGPV